MLATEPVCVMKAMRIRVRGLVQGVGFRPHVWLVARAVGVSGHVLNDASGVEIEAWGTAAQIDRFLADLRTKAPPLARIDAIETQDLATGSPPAGFDIAESAGGQVATGIVPDAATCPACLADIADPANRRHAYPFTNCTHCGPRLSIIRAIPYDRETTAMADFAMCPACLSEYRDPADRRFHAQPNACPVCGPRVWLEDRSGPVEAADPIARAARMIDTGAIVAVKGLGGFHLACDATSASAVNRLRARKRRDAKPLAVMMPDLAHVRACADLDAEEVEWLSGKVAPILLVAVDGSRSGDGAVPRLAAGIAPGQDRLGVMLPYTPLHALLMQAVNRPLVMTSGNLSNEPQATANDEARERLADIADAWLMHDRDIVNRLDDSVMRVDGPGTQVLRRARGLAPEPIALPVLFARMPSVLAMGGELKSAFCLARDGEAILSQHMGDLEEVAVHADFRKNLTLYRDLFRFRPDAIAVDAHPDYLSTQWGEALAEEAGVPLIHVQHHHAHLAACLADNAVEPDDDETLGIILDGLGAGPDGTVWGGEFLAGGYRGYRRVGHFQPVALPGGARAMREPWRNLAAQLHACFGDDLAGRIAGTPFAARLADKPLQTIETMIVRGINSPLSSSAGRLFEAVAAALDVHAEWQSHEGQAAMALEAMARPHLETAGAYPADIDRFQAAGDESVDGGADATSPRPLVLSWGSLWRALLDDLTRGEDRAVMAARFHNGLAEAIVALTMRLADNSGLQRVALSGGVMQNAIVNNALHGKLTASGLQVLVHRKAPANDGGLALGQAVIAQSSS